MDKLPELITYCFWFSTDVRSKLSKKERKNPYFWHSALLQLDLHVVPVLFHLKPANGLILTGLWHPCAGVGVFVCECDTHDDSVWGTEADNRERSTDSQKNSHSIYSHLGLVHMSKDQKTFSYATGKTMHFHATHHTHTGCTLSHAFLNKHHLKFMWSILAVSYEQQF